MTSIDAILAAKYPAKAHARRVAESLKAQGGAGAIYLEAQKTRLIEDSDEDMPFRQRRPFFYLTGCLLPNAAVVYDVVADQLTLFIPPIDPESVIWSGLPLSPEEAAKLYDVDRVLFTSDINSTLASIASAHNGQTTAFAIAEQFSDGTSFQGFAKTNTTSLKTAIEDTRVVKDAYEVALLRKANEISTKAHIAAIQAAKTATNEREIEAAIIGTCIANGCREQSYHPIVAGGEGGATLHYVRNDVDLVDPVTKQRKNNVLIDAGGEYQTYCADITRVIPLNGRFAPETRQIYEIVLQMQTECIAMLKEGVNWDDVHALAHRIAIRGLLKLGILRGSEDELFEKRVSVAFFPHGLGHYLGMDTHDTGGNPNYKDGDIMFRYLRVRAKLPAGSVVTVEPGIYFCRFIIDPVLKAPDTGKYIDAEVLERYWSVGGVRIEDNIHITKDGSENLTTAPKAIEEVESLAL
ncbi:uncharacterized protein N7515_001892 [Penicillium bovifimosum]|uniref:Probable Xaa-Pro aminopeptidase PEPP n=1 Tax=Penicillium bovifimosum TaxID=126998 RepID=A0A9W9HAL1_9EURO|nr:uncharacterized protein N7515_001892 [Penicillium bovifimosum]KAJ5143105.1 hypothetical protein N7515_001892 [Penicillium bovifimosum]